MICISYSWFVWLSHWPGWHTPSICFPAAARWVKHKCNYNPSRHVKIRKYRLFWLQLHVDRYNPSALGERPTYIYAWSGCQATAVLCRILKRDFRAWLNTVCAIGVAYIRVGCPSYIYIRRCNLTGSYSKTNVAQGSRRTLLSLVPSHIGCRMNWRDKVNVPIEPFYCTDTSPQWDIDF